MNQLPRKQWTPQHWKYLVEGRVLCVWDATEVTCTQESKQRTPKSLSFLRIYDYKKKKKTTQLFYLSFPLPRTYGTISRVHMGGFYSQKKKMKERKKQEYLSFPTQAFSLPGFLPPQTNHRLLGSVTCIRRLTSTSTEVFCGFIIAASQILKVTEGPH